MTDRELLESAAKAAGIDLSTADWGGGRDGFYWVIYDQPGRVEYWSPLTDDGDALRLAVKLGLAISIDAVEQETWAHHDQVMLGSREWWPAHPTTEHGNEDMYAATRRAIVRAAAEIGRQA
jgi:hypothetical protein